MSSGSFKLLSMSPLQAYDSWTILRPWELDKQGVLHYSTFGDVRRYKSTPYNGNLSLRCSFNDARQLPFKLLSMSSLQAYESWTILRPWEPDKQRSPYLTFVDVRRYKLKPYSGNLSLQCSFNDARQLPRTHMLIL